MGMHKDQDIVDLPVKNPTLFGLALRDLRLPFDAIIMSIRRRGVVFVPHDFTRLEAGDLVTVVGSKKSLKETAYLLSDEANAAHLHKSIKSLKDGDWHGNFKTRKEAREYLQND